MHILGRSAGISVDRLRVRALLAVAAQTVLVVGLAGHFVDGVWLVGASCWCGARLEGLSVEFGRFVGLGGFGAELVLFQLADHSFEEVMRRGGIPISRGERRRQDGWDGRAGCPRRRWSGCFE
jgi:hypothetical protein